MIAPATLIVTVAVIKSSSGIVSLMPVTNALNVHTFKDVPGNVITQDEAADVVGGDVAASNAMSMSYDPLSVKSPAMNVSIVVVPMWDVLIDGRLTPVCRIARICAKKLDAKAIVVPVPVLGNVAAIF